MCLYMAKIYGHLFTNTSNTCGYEYSRHFCVFGIGFVGGIIICLLGFIGLWIAILALFRPTKRGLSLRSTLSLPSTLRFVSPLRVGTLSQFLQMITPPWNHRQERLQPEQTRLLLPDIISSPDLQPLELRGDVSVDIST